MSDGFVHWLAAGFLSPQNKWNDFFAAHSQVQPQLVCIEIATQLATRCFLPLCGVLPAQASMNVGVCW